MKNAILATLVAAMAAHAEPPPNKSLADLFERETLNHFQEHPEQATLLGIHEFDGKLTDNSPEAVARRKAHVKHVIADLRGFDPKELSSQDRISRNIALEAAELDDRENAFYGDLPFSSDDGWLVASTMRGPQLFLPYIVNGTRFANGADYENYLERLEGLPAELDKLVARMRVGMRTGWMPPKAAMVKVPAMFEPYTGADVTASPMWKPFNAFPDDVAPADRERIATRARLVLSGKVQPAFARMQRFLADEYLPACRKELGASSLPAGRAYYELRIRENTTLALTAAQIHKIGLDEVARIHGEMDKVIASTGFKGSFDDFARFTRTDPRFFFKTPEARLAAYRDIAKRADAELPKLFATLPRLPYGVRAMEAYEGDNSDHYSPGPLDGSRAGFFEANVHYLASHSSIEMESTLLHEAVPGHHLQNSRALEIEGLPKFRRFGWYVAYGEGWALYAESLGYEMGFYKDPYQHFGTLANEMMRACRLVVDTGIHAMGWTREQAIAYMGGNTGMHPDYVASEIDRYIVMPGQALGYKIGELDIKRLRAKAKAELGDKFDVRRFHNAVLDDGALPLTVLDARIDEWIATEKAK
ncbi:MAG TPA: DUF885 domain-containing protein [Usitatibacter sp.]|jgi:uncharacterized protein (DUF885 family)|nr:DUF885 domain-containing protein [Usitatibacter sp.]